MKRIKVKVYMKKIPCPDCYYLVKGYYTVADFGDPPIIQRCMSCNQHYWYTHDDEYYIKPYKEQISNLKCIKCNKKLKDSLVNTSDYIMCDNCNDIFSVDEYFFGKEIPKDDDMVSLEVYSLY